jgi:hypothetical protein
MKFVYIVGPNFVAIFLTEKVMLINLATFVLGFIFGDFFTKASGHPDWKVLFVHTYLTLNFLNTVIYSEDKLCPTGMDIYLHICQNTERSTKKYKSIHLALFSHRVSAILNN